MSENTEKETADPTLEVPKTSKDKSVDQLFDEMEQFANMDHEKNAKFRRRLVFLFPYNLALLWGTIKYSRNIHKISKIFWPSRRKFTIGNFILVGTLQAIFFTSLYAGGNLAIIGINPFKPQEAFKENSEFVQGSSSVVVFKALKYVGLSDDTLKRIEADLKNSQKDAKEKENEEESENSTEKKE